MLPFLSSPLSRSSVYCSRLSYIVQVLYCQRFGYSQCDDKEDSAPQNLQCNRVSSLPSICVQNHKHRHVIMTMILYIMIFILLMVKFAHV